MFVFAILITFTFILIISFIPVLVLQLYYTISLGNSVLASAELRNRAAYEYDSGSNRMKPFDHTRILQGLSAVGEEIPGYHVNQREPTEKEIKKSNRTH